MAESDQSIGFHLDAISMLSLASQLRHFANSQVLLKSELQICEPDMNQAKFFSVAMIVTCCVVFSGCHMTPNFGPQGSIGMQRNFAVLHDPFPSNDLGPPIVGGRPLGFEQPWAQPRINQDSPYARRGARVVQPSGF